MKLHDAGVIITGATQGLGRALALKLIKKGSKVLTCSRGRSKTNEVNENWYDYPADITKQWMAARIIRKAELILGKVDILVNNAAATHELKPIEKVRQSDVERCFETNVYSIFHLLRSAMPVMKRQNNGLIVNISSYCGRRAVPNLSAYCASKFAVRGITEAVAKEIEGTGIKCISISPGGMNTDMRARLFGSEEAAEQQNPGIVAARIVEVIEDKHKVPNGADVVIRKGEFSIRTPES